MAVAAEFFRTYVGGQSMKFITRKFPAVLVGMVLAAPALAQNPEPAGESGYISILDAAPPAYYGILRVPKFYGDPNMDRSTIDGPILGRQYLLGSLGGARDKWAENGLVVDASVTQTVQGVASGDGDGAQYFGSADLFMALDTGRAKWWSGGLIFAHLEGDWGQVVEGSGALLPLNFDTTMPAAPSKFALSELYLFQGLPNDWAVVAGKVNWSAWADKNLFANDERNQFLHTGLNNNPILGSFVPYTSLGGGIFKQASKEVSLGVVITSNNTKATSAGFDDLSADTMTYGFAGNWAPKINGRPGLYNLLLGYTTKDLAAYDIDDKHLIGEIIGAIPVVEKGSNRAVALGGSQYLWGVDENVKRWDGLPVGVGPFFRFGWAPKDRNVITQFYSVGIGGNGGLMGRVNDNWGIGWAGTKISSDFRRDAAVLGFTVNSFEHAVEGFYNFALTPAIKLSVHAQGINSANPKRDNAFVLGSRLQLDF